MKRMNFPTRKDQRRNEAIERQKKRDNLTDKQQITKLKRNGFTAKKEIERLSK
jgi:hypothetical protein